MEPERSGDRLPARQPEGLRAANQNRIKEQQLCLFAGRTSCHRWWPNQLRLMLSTLAYVFIDTLRRRALRGAELAKAQVKRIRLELLKIGEVVVRNTKRVTVHLSGSWPRHELFETVHGRLVVTQRMSSNDSAAPALKKREGAGRVVPGKCDFRMKALSIFHSGYNPTLQAPQTRLRWRS